MLPLFFKDNPRETEMFQNNAPEITDQCWSLRG